MARRSRLRVCLLTDTPYSSNSHWIKSTIRQLTTPCDAGIGPCSMTSASARLCSGPSTGRGPGTAQDRLAVQQTVGALGIEPQNPVPNRLQADAADPRRFVSRAAIANLPQLAMLNQIIAALGIPRVESEPKGLGMRWLTSGGANRINSTR